MSGVYSFKILLLNDAEPSYDIMPQLLGGESILIDVFYVTI